MATTLMFGYVGCQPDTVTISAKDTLLTIYLNPHEIWRRWLLHTVRKPAHANHSGKNCCPG